MLHDRFVSVDWGTSNLRVRLAHGGQGAIVGQIATEDGVARIAASHSAMDRVEAYRQTLARAIEQLAANCGEDLSGLPVVISGMASSTLGWKELPYARLPFALDGTSLSSEVLSPWPEEQGRSVLLLSGVRSANDIMRGEETEALGLWQFLATPGTASHDAWPAIWIFPGTHSKHLLVERGMVVDFFTHMTGELFDVLRMHSVLRHATVTSVNDAFSSASSDRGDFQAGLDEARELPLTSALFHVRTRSVLQGKEGPAGAAFLSGLLVGAEIAAIEQRVPQVGQIVLCAATKLAEPYERAIEHFGLTVHTKVIPVEVASTLSVRGHSAALNRL